MALTLVPITQEEALVFVDRHHRHSNPPIIGCFAIGVAKDGEIVGVAIAGRPVSRVLDDGWTLEVTRLVTDGTRNACSMLYGACKRAGKAMGYTRFITYTLTTESGASLRGAGWEDAATVRAKSWHTPSRPRVDKHELQTRILSRKLPSFHDNQPWGKENAPLGVPRVPARRHVAQGGRAWGCSEERNYLGESVDPQERAPKVQARPTRYPDRDGGSTIDHPFR